MKLLCRLLGYLGTIEQIRMCVQCIQALEEIMKYVNYQTLTHLNKIWYLGEGKFASTWIDRLS